ncbi:hypothetical protein [Poseidonocella sedimentorum]|uniref:Phosphate ABC transporter substrate-binding protein, PhoT family n=1 Tax=Poseidonocella sedimentorum TaxID=871652 RepID=A0A1I6D4D1_9RHOB|nr:hypothetical protein [Poseidonocella sedimentorum]SFR00251.1 phosphate ABC transporter substrate-binding protein, PhoT family [Poseidonocella sedimentorum]
MSPARLWLLCAAILLAPLSARAEEITLRAPDADFAFSGQLLGFDGRYFRIDSAYGILTLDGQGLVCDGAPCPDRAAFAPTLRIATDPALAPVLWPALVEAFARGRGLEVERFEAGARHSGLTLRSRGEDGADGALRFTVRLHTTDASEGVADLLAGEADLLAAARALTEDELMLLQGAGLGALDGPHRQRRLARDALVPVAEDGAPPLPVELSDLMLDVLEPEEGGAPLARGGNQADRWHHLTGGASARPVSPSLLPYAASRGARTRPLQGACGLRQTARDATLRSGDYALTVPLRLYIPAPRLPALSRAFLAYLDSDAAQRVIRRAGFIDALPAVASEGLSKERLRNAVLQDGASLARLRSLVAELGDRSRLAVDLRGDAGRSEQQLRRVIAALQRDAGDILIIGFGGTEAQSLARAEALRERLLAHWPEGADAMTARGFGGALPLVCDDAPGAARINARVEIWLAPSAQR